MAKFKKQKRDDVAVPMTSRGRKALDTTSVKCPRPFVYSCGRSSKIGTLLQAR